MTQEQFAERAEYFVLLRKTRNVARCAINKVHEEMDFVKIAQMEHADGQTDLAIMCLEDCLWRCEARIWQAKLAKWREQGYI